MKAYVYVVLLVVTLVFSLSGCQDQEKIIVKSVQSDPRTNEFPTKLNEFSFDLDSDNEEEKIEVYTAAGYGPDGKMLWDDGQRWLLVVVDGNKYYPLYSEFVQQGEVFFSLSRVGEQMIPQVNVYISTQGGMEIIDFVSNNKKEQYEGKVVYRPKDKVQYYTSIPSY